MCLLQNKIGRQCNEQSIERAGTITQQKSCIGNLEKKAKRMRSVWRHRPHRFVRSHSYKCINSANVYWSERRNRSADNVWCAVRALTRPQIDYKTRTTTQHTIFFLLSSVLCLSIFRWTRSRQSGAIVVLNTKHTSRINKCGRKVAAARQTQQIESKIYRTAF